MSGQPFRFVDLPEKVRSSVYQLLLCSFEEPAVFADDAVGTVPVAFTRAKHHVEIAILSANRQIHGEAREILLKGNQFVRVEVRLQVPNVHTVVNGTIVAKRVPIVTFNEDAISKFRGQVMSYTITEKPDSHNYSMCCMILHRDFDLLCHSLANVDVDMPGFWSQTEHTIVLHEPCQDFPSTAQQEHLLAPFRRHLRELDAVIIQGKVEPSLVNSVLSEVKTSSVAEPDKIIEDLQQQKEVGNVYFQNGNVMKSGEAWGKACIEIKRLRDGPKWEGLASNKTFLDNLTDLFFTLNVNLARNNISIAEQNRNDPYIASVIANSALGALESASERFSDVDVWEPTPQQMAKFWLIKANAHRLREDYNDALQAIELANGVSPDDPAILEERRNIISLVGS